MTDKPKTAAELLAELRQNREFAAREKARAEKMNEVLETSEKEQDRLLSELADIGLKIASVWDLVNKQSKYPAALPILIRHLSLPYSSGVREGIIRALTVDYAGSEALRVLISEFLRQNDDTETSLKWVLGNAISTVAQSSDAETLISLALDRSQGKARDMIITALPRVVKDKSRLRDVLDALRSDRDMREFVRRAESDL